MTNHEGYEACRKEWDKQTSQSPEKLGYENKIDNM